MGYSPQGGTESDTTEVIEHKPLLCIRHFIAYLNHKVTYPGCYYSHFTNVLFLSSPSFTPTQSLPGAWGLLQESGSDPSLSDYHHHQY